MDRPEERDRPRDGGRAEFEDAEAGPALPSASLVAGAGAELGRPRRVRRGSYGEIWSLAWPVMISQVLLNAVSLIDLAMVGRLGPTSLAAVGYATQFFFLSQSVLFAVGFACVAVMARAIGAGEPEVARRALAASIGVALVAALLLNGLILAAPGTVLGWLGAESAVIAAALPYLTLVLSASVLLAVSMTLESGLRADRDTRTPLAVAAVVALIKIAGNGLLMFGAFGLPRLELVGAGLATLGSQVMGLAIFVTLVIRAREGSPLALRWADFRAARPLVPQVVRLSLPGVGERLAHNFALLAYFRVLSGYGTLAIAAYTVGVRLLSFSWIPGVGLGMAASTLVGQALGAEDRRGARRAGWRATRVAAIVAAVLGLGCALFPRELARLFTVDAELVEYLVPFLVCLAISQPALQAQFTLGGALRGAGDTYNPFVAAIVGNWGLRVPLAFLFAWVWQTDVVWIWIVIIADHVSRTLWLGAVFRRGRWEEQPL